MRILFVYPNITKQESPQIGIASLLTLIAQKHTVTLFDTTDVPNGKYYSAFMETAQKFQPDAVLISCRSNEWGYVRGLVEKCYPMPVIVGGIHATINTEEVLQTANIAVRGEAEKVILQLLDTLQRGKDISKIPNVWVKRKGRIIKNDVLPLVEDLDTLPKPSFELFSKTHFESSYITSLFDWIKCVGTFETSRGCPFSCTYCCNEYLQRLYKGKGTWHRQKSVARVADEIKDFKLLYPDCNFLYFVDETFMTDKGWLQDFKCSHDGTPYVFMTRPEMVTYEKMKLVADSGAKAVSIGVESGNEEFRKKVLNRHTTQQQIIDAFKISHDCGLQTYSFNMVGLPYETKRDILTTIALNKRLKPSISQFTIFFPFKGTKLYDICKAEGYLNGEYPDIFHYYKESFLNHPNYKKGELKQWVDRAEKEIMGN